MGKIHKKRGWARKLLAGLAIAALLSSLFVFLTLPKAQALELDFNNGLDEALCQTLGNDGVINCGSDSATSFTNFDGDFVPPDSTGYASGITETDSVREFVVNVTNFVLSFLGLAAIVVIIYGGFLYVTAAGEQERADKGKKSVMYAVIGIIIVLVSYALVNTIITGAAGGSDAPSRGFYASGVTGDSLDGLASQQMSQRIRHVTEEFVQEYTAYTNVIAVVDAMVNVGKFNKAGLREMEDGFALILRQVDPFSTTADSANKALQLLDRYLSVSFGEKVRQFANTSNGWMKATVLLAQFPPPPPPPPGPPNPADLPVCPNPQPGVPPPAPGSCRPATPAPPPPPPGLPGGLPGGGLPTPSNPGTNPFDNSDPYRVGEALTTYIQITAQVAHEEFKLKLAKLTADLIDMQGSFTELSSISGILQGALTELATYQNSEKYSSRNATLSFATAQALDSPEMPELPQPTLPPPPGAQILEQLGVPMQPPPALPPLPSPPPPPPSADQPLIMAVPGSKTFTYKTQPEGGSRKIGNVVEQLNQLYGLVRNLRFTSAVLKANTKEGNAPLTVTFDGLDSSDPTNTTITADRYEWDLLGNGFAEEDDDVTGANVSYLYERPGTYRVALRVRSSDPANIAAGISYLSIKINPPSSIISLNASTTFGQGRLEENIQELPEIVFTGEQARAGILFDAGETTDGNGNTDTIVNYKFTFGDGESVTGATSEVTHYYNNEGRYPFELEVTDQNGVKDRERLDIVVNSPAANIKPSAKQADIGETLFFDGSGSLTDFGVINTYSWEIIKNTETILSEENGESELSHEFKKPGEYIIRLNVTDSSGKQNGTQTKVTIKSTPPVSTFTERIPSASQPSRVHFDASKSYDPDEGDEVSYEWVIEGTEGVHYNFVENTNATSSKPIVEFYSKGSYNIVLNVRDQHPEGLKQMGTFNKDVDIQSILSISAHSLAAGAVFLDDKGKANVSIEVKSNTGISYEINWGDGTPLQTVPASSPGGALQVDHNYTAAGRFPVMVTVYDETDASNSVTRNVYVGNGEAPIPIIDVYIDGAQAPDTNNITANRRNIVRLSAARSVDSNGQALNQPSLFSWSLGDGTLFTGKEVTRTYEEIGTFEVTLTVRSQADPTTSSNATLQVNVEAMPPRIFNLTVEPQGSELKTPLSVKVTANADDPDGNITRYKFWYYDVNNSAKKLGEQISLTNSTFLTINTNGTTGEEIDYEFGVEITDNENNVVNSFDEIPESQIARLSIVNGPNQPPVAEFTVDRTNVLVNETLYFTSNSHDPDGQVVKYIYDVEGDGFYNNEEQVDPFLNYEYNEPYPQGVKVRLKVIDDTGANAVSDPIRIFVDSLTDDPEAAFVSEIDELTVRFKNNSIADIENGATLVSYAWDFDTNVDTDGNGNATDDIDSTDQNPVHTYESFGRHTVKLIVTDNEGNTDEVSNVVNLIEVSPPVASFRSTIDDLEVTFADRSKAGSKEIPLVSYAWDFDNDGITDNTKTSPTYTYEDYGTYSVVLTVTDELDRSATARETLRLVEPEPEPLIAFLNSTPAPEQGGAYNGKIALNGTSGNVTFSFSSTGAEGNVTYCIDKNVYFDSDNNGRPDDDCNHSATQAGSWATDFQKEWGLIVIRLVTTDDGGRTYNVTREVVFKDPMTGQLNVLPVTTQEALYILLMALSFALLGAKLYNKEETKN